MNTQSAVISNKLAIPVKSKAKKSKVKSTAKKSSVVISKQTWLKVGMVFLTLAILIGGGFSYIKAYDGKIYPKITVAGIKIGGMSAQEAKTALNAKITELNENGPKITYNDQTITPKLEEMGVSFNVDEAISRAYQFGRNDNLISKLSENYQAIVKNYQIPLTPQINKEKFDAYLGHLQQSTEKEPVNASLVITNGQISLVEPQAGLGLDKEKLKNELTALVESGKTSGEIILATSKLEAPIQAEGTVEAKAQAEKYISAAPITVTFETSSWTADRAEIGSWIKFNTDGNKLSASVSPAPFVSYIAQQVEVPTIDKEIQDGTATVLSEGQDGRGVDTNTLTAQINDSLGNGKPATFALGTYAIARGEKIIYPHAQPGRYAGRYIDINLSEQMLYAFEGSNLVNQFLVSTGKSGYATPTGEFNVYGKDSSALMDGPDYYLPGVPYISWFSGDYSIHGTYWHSNFGHPMSHGCVNMATPDAEWIFNWDDVGTPVYIHY